jgi:hypothetical protein
MKTVLSIPLILLIIFSGISVTFATHYCGGSVADTRVSLNGKLATCGMEQQLDNNLLKNIFTSKCCDDIATTYSICNNYIPSSYLFNEPGQKPVSNLFVRHNSFVSHKIIINTAKRNEKPPGINVPNLLSRPALCVFLI